MMSEGRMEDGKDEDDGGSGGMVVVVLGCTGVGKTKLSIALAQELDGEVINCDAMQMYKGLDIITNKATPEEMSNVPHHLLGMLPPLAESNVVEFNQRAQRVITRLHQQNKMPILVGGTHYYIETVLTAAASAGPPKDAPQQTAHSTPQADRVASLSDEEAYVTLKT